MEHPDATMPPVGRLHHIGYLVADITAAAEHWQHSFGYQVESDVIEDPTQTARVQFLRLPGESHWLELVSPDGSDSKLQNALAKKIRLHHLCYEVENIETVLKSLRQAGLFIVSEPVPAQAFPGRRIAWVMDAGGYLFELVEAGQPPLSSAHLAQSLR